MKEKIRYFIAGIFIGLSELLPGISGATVALMFGVYEKILTFLNKFKEIHLIAPLMLGMILSVVAFSSLINFLYENFSNIFNIFIAFLMIGYGLYLVIKTYLQENVRKGILFYINLFSAILVGFLLSVFYLSGFSFQEPELLVLFTFGFVACTFLLFPGISGSAFLLSVGAYPLIIGSIANFNFNVLLPFGLGMLMAILIMPRFINMAYKKYGESILVFFGGLIFTAGINSFL